MLKLVFITFLSLWFAHSLWAQQKVGDRWVDDGLQLVVVDDQLKASGSFSICIQDTVNDFCIENLTTGVTVWVYSASDEILWEGIASGRTPRLVLPRSMPDAHYLVVEAFKPFVINKLTATRIHQSEPLRTKYYIK